MTVVKARFAVEPGQRDKARDHLSAHGYGVIEVDDGGGEEVRGGAVWPVLVVSSADDIVDADHHTFDAHATAVGNLLQHGGFDYRFLAGPNDYVDAAGVRRLRS